ncbi:Inositol monophosphatase family [Popillia japonica]|uniref:Inositol-1-monophosphatase n=1 Tax=Popillia japonica TaxID=7064 RepID=A0AAW1MJ18_POPJA
MCENNNRKVTEYFEYARALVLEAGNTLREAKDVQVETKEDAKDVQVETKEDVWDLVTQYDLKVEEILVKKLKEQFPTHKFIGEEESAMTGRIPELTNDPTWIIDPIDGTANYVRKMPIFGVSVALTIDKEIVAGIVHNPFQNETYTAIKGTIDKEIVAGIVHNPFQNETYTAIKGEGAYRNGIKIRTSGVTEIERSNLNYELSLARSEKLKPMYMHRLHYLISIMEGIRSLGCASIGLCYVACGYNDAYQCDGLKPWDAAAGVLIVREAGGYVCDSSVENLGQEFDLMNPNFLAAASRALAQKYIAIERKADQERLANAKCIM